MGGLQDLVVSMALAQLALGNAGSAGAAGDGDQAQRSHCCHRVGPGTPASSQLGGRGLLARSRSARPVRSKCCQECRGLD